MAVGGALTYGELKARAEGLAEVGGYTNTASPPDWGSLVNLAYNEWAWLTECNTVSATLAATSVVGQAEYALSTIGSSADWKRIISVRFGTDYLRLERTTETALERRYPEWDDPSLADSTPEFWWRPNPYTLRVWPEPDTASLSFIVRGVRCFDAMTDDDEYPQVPAVYHSSLADRAFVEEALRWATGDARQQLQDAIARFVLAAQSYKALLTGEGVSGVSRFVKDEAADRITP